MGKTDEKGMAVADSGGEHDVELGAPLFSWGVTPMDVWMHRVGIAGGLSCVLAMALLFFGKASGLALGVLVAGALAGGVAQAYGPNRGDSFQVFEGGLTDGDRTLTWGELADARFETTDEVTRVGGTETGRVTTYMVELVGRDGTTFQLEGVGDEAEARFAWLREAAGRVLEAGAPAPEALPPGDSE